MAQNSKIEWTESTWNPVTGCRKISAGCKNCYAERMAKRLKAMGKELYRNGFEPTLHPEVVERPLRWKKPRIIFVNSMSDLFMKDVPFEFIQTVFDVMNRAERHIFQVLTKRPHIAARYANRLSWTDNIWMGTTIENEKVVNRIKHLQKIPAKIRFLSVEPLISEISELPLEGVDWVIAGGESGPGARPMDAKWVRQIRDECVYYGVPFFFKQWGGVNKKKNGRLLDGRTWDEMPEVDIHKVRGLEDGKKR